MAYGKPELGFKRPNPYAMLTLVLSTFYLAAGTRSALVKAVAETTKLPVAILGQGTDKLRAVKFEFDAPSDFRRELRNTFGFSASSADGLGFGGPGWPTETLPVFPPSGGRLAALRYDPVVVKDGLVDIDGTTNLTALGTAFGKKITASWVLDFVPITVRASGSSAQEFWNVIASAFGGTFSAGASPSIVIPPETLAARIIRGYDDLSRLDTDPVMAARNALRVRFLRALSPKEFAALYEAPGRDATRIGVSGSAIHTAVYSLARTTLAARPRGERSPLGQLRSQVDLRKPVEVRFNNNGQLSVSFPTDRGPVALNL